MRREGFDVGEYVDQVALLLDLQLRDEYRDGVVANFERIMAIANLVNEFPLTEDIETAPIFEP
jgi:Asp-tRNA(Asn)/Glu-tRNA(Gln) amidotransferase C subunit